MPRPRSLAPIVLTFALLFASVVPSASLGASADVPRLAPVQTTDDRWGINHVYSSAAQQRLAREAGAAWNRWEFRWDSLEPNRGQMRWSLYDSMVDASVAGGLTITGILISTPDWAREPSTGLPRGLYRSWNDPENLWARFVQQTVQHYRGKVRYWEVWNEPDYKAIFWSGTNADYYQMLKVTYLSVKSVDPNAQVLMGGLAYWPETGFLEDLLHMMAADPIARQNNYFFDILPWHTYARPSDAYDRAVQSRQLLTQTIGAKPIWLNETNVPAWNESPIQNYRPYPWSATVEEQASYLLQTIAFALAGSMDKIFVYRMQDTEDPEAFGLLRNDGSHRPAYVALQVAARHLSHINYARIARQGDAEQIIMRRPGERIAIVWNRTPHRMTTRFGATGTSAKLIDQSGTERTIQATAGQYQVELPPATANNGNHAGDYIMGGPPFLIIEALPATRPQIEESSAHIAYAGTWENVSTAGPSGNALRRTVQPGAGVAAEFSGSSVTWLTTKGPDRGIARVEVDGVLQGEVDLYSPTTVWEVPLTFGDFSPGAHRIVVTATGRRNPASASALVDVDAFNAAEMRNNPSPLPAVSPPARPFVTSLPPGGRAQASAFSAVPASGQTVALPVVMRNRNGLTTFIEVQNSGADAPATVRFMDESGRQIALTELTLASNGSHLLDPRVVNGLPEGFVGSAVVESSAPIGASVTEVREGVDALAYSGALTGGERSYVPLLFKGYNGWDTGLQVQNLGDAPATVTVSYRRSNGPGGPWTERATIPARSATTFFQPANAQLPADFVGSAVVEGLAGSKLATIVNQVHQSGSGSSYEGASSGANQVSVPLLFKNANGWATGVQVQNVGTTPTDVTVTYVATDGRGPWQERQVVVPGASATFYQPANRELPEGFVGSAVISSNNNQPLVAIVNEVHTGRNVSMTYRGFTEGATLLTVPHASRNVNGWSTGIQVQNISGTDAHVALVLQDANGVLVRSQEDTVRPGASVTYYLPSMPGIPDGWQGSASIVSVGSEQLAAIVNQTRY